MILPISPVLAIGIDPLDPPDEDEGYVGEPYFIVVSPVIGEYYLGSVPIEIELTIPEEVLEDPEFSYEGIGCAIYNTSSREEDFPDTVWGWTEYFVPLEVEDLPDGDYTFLATDLRTAFVEINFHVGVNPAATPSPSPSPSPTAAPTYSSGYTASIGGVPTPTPAGFPVVASDSYSLIFIVIAALVAYYVLREKK